MVNSINRSQITYYSSLPLYPSTYKGMSLSFDGKRLISVTLPDGNHFEYKYNVEGLRIKRSGNRSGTVTYSYSGNKLILQQSSSLKLEFLYDEKDNLYGFIKNNNERYYYIRDALGNILGIINQNGQIVVQYSYTSYGVCSISGNTSLGNENPFRYKGYYYDVETSLYYLITRYYDPEIGRFISPDSVDYLNPQSINGLNLYCYCYNDPINYADPDGHMPFLCALLILGAIGMVANVGSQALTDLAYGNEFKWDNYLVAAGAGFLGGMCYAIPGVGSIVSAAVTSGLTTVGQMAVSGEDYDGWDYLIMAGGSAVLSGLTARRFGKLSNNMAFFKDSNFILDKFTKFATNYGNITLKPTVILQAAGQIAIRETVAGFVGAPLSGIPGYFDRVYRLNKLGLSPADSLRYAL
ncbi:MAG: RHS repeat-associated core domain-containing protein [Bacillales bacterium]|nr:RHS repeat-associated core domain-containing protein [Bacillales bacterium]